MVGIFLRREPATDTDPVHRVSSHSGALAGVGVHVAATTGAVSWLVQVVPIHPLAALGVGSLVHVAGSTTVGPEVCIKVHVVPDTAVQLPPTVVTAEAAQLLPVVGTQTLTVRQSVLIKFVPTYAPPELVQLETVDQPELVDVQVWFPEAA